MEQITRIGMDTSKHVFQLHGVNAAEAPVLRKKLRRKEMVTFFEQPCPDSGRNRGVRRFSSLGTVSEVARPPGETDRAPAGEALRQAGQERHGRRGSHLRGDESANHAVRASQVDRATGGFDAGRLARSASP